MNFIKQVLATIVGLIIVNIIGFFFLMMMIGAIAALSSEPMVVVNDNSILKVSFDNVLMDKASNNPLEDYDFINMKPMTKLSLNKIVSSIKKAKNDDRIKAIYLELTDISSSYGSLAFAQEIRSAIREFKESGKPVYAYSDFGYSQVAYYLATVADSLYVNPQTPLILTGISSSTVYYKDALDKLGLKAELIKVGKFKSAAEPYVSDKMSEENRLQIDTYINSLWNSIVSEIAKSRNIKEKDINNMVNNFKIRTNKNLVELGYFDDVKYKGEMLDLLEDNLDTDNIISISKYQNADTTTEVNTYDRDKIAVVYAQGEITHEDAPYAVGPEFAKIIRELRKDDDIEGVVLRVNSPGGSALVSEQIWYELKTLSDYIPTATSMANVAASGGYYIASATDYIVAEPTTLTGSIGIFGLFLTGKELTEKLGLKVENVKTHKYSDFGGAGFMGLPYRDLSVYERNVLQNYINEGYDLFLDRVAQGRNMTKAEVNKIAQGRVWTGADALKINLVDDLGGLQEAINEVAFRANLNDYEIVEYPKEKEPIEQILDDLGIELKTRMVKSELGVLYQPYTTIKTMIENNGIMARLPYEFVVQ